MCWDSAVSPARTRIVRATCKLRVLLLREGRARQGLIRIRACHHVPDLAHHGTSDAQCVNKDFALDAFDVDNLCVGPHRGQQVSGARQAIHFVA